MLSKKFRQERDTMGVVDVPADAMWGASTQRAVENFSVSGLVMPARFIQALGLVKLACATVNEQDGLLNPKLARAIKRVCAEIAAGKHRRHFPVDVFQTGSGTSSNMNANEAIAIIVRNRLGGARGDWNLVHPNDHVNLGQSSNDVVPTAIHVAASIAITEELLPAVHELIKQLGGKEQEFAEIIKTGRTHLQDGTPVTLGQEFSGYRSQLEGQCVSLLQARERLSELAIGGTAVGTGVNTRADFGRRVAEELANITKIAFRETNNHFQAQSTLDAVVAASATLKGLAVSLMKIANDIRWMASGPRAGLAELILPAVQPGSSIMPGKINPVIAESVCQVAAQVIGNDLAITVAGQSGNFELVVMMPVAAYNLIMSIEILARVQVLFAKKVVQGLQAGAAGPLSVERGLGLATALVPRLGYDRATEIAKLAASSGRTVREVALEVSGLSADELRVMLDPERMIKPDPPVKGLK